MSLLVWGTFVWANPHFGKTSSSIDTLPQRAINEMKNRRDTLPKRVINGLEVIPIKILTPEGEIWSWRLRVPIFEKCFQRFESKFPGIICNNSSRSRATMGAIYDWQDYLWYKVVPEEMRTRFLKAKRFVIRLYIDKEGEIFMADFDFDDKTFQELESLPPNTLKNLYEKLLSEKCNEYKKVDFCINPLDTFTKQNRMLDRFGSLGEGKEYIIEELWSAIFYMLGTTNLCKEEEMRNHMINLEKQEAQDKEKDKF